MVFPCFYNAPVSYYSILIKKQDAIKIEQFDHYIRQTYRNRCKILGANGIIDLVVPVVKNHGKKTLMKDVLVDYDTHWNRTHWKSIQAAYTSAPFYEFIADSFAPLLEKKYKFLVDLNLELLKETLDLLHIQKEIVLTEDFHEIKADEDLFQSIQPKHTFSHANINFEAAWYQQVFADRHGHKKDLSIIDLLMNEGSDARSILLKST